MKFAIGYIEHDKEVFDKYLGKSLSNLKGDFDVINTSDIKKPASNYNDIINLSKNDWIILTHQDISFSDDILYHIENTINEIEDDKFCIGLVGVTNKGEYKWSKDDEIFKLETVDCCFLVINKKHNIKFDEETFDDFHLYVEDYCVQIGNVYTIKGISGYKQSNNSYISHHSVTLNKLGSCWGRYFEYKQKLWQKWNKKIMTT